MAQTAYSLARESYAALGVDTEAALRKLRASSISLHCWQGDDVGGFEKPNATLSGGGIQATGNYRGKARTIAQLREDLEKVYSLLPGKHRLNLHAIYGDFSDKLVDRDEIEVPHFQSWIDWCATNGLGLDFNPTCFSHPLAKDGFTLSHPDKHVRRFWINHCMASRRIGAVIGRKLGKTCVTNVSPRFSVNDLKGRLITLQERRQLGWVLEFVWARTDADWQPGAGGAERVVG